MQGPVGYVGVTDEGWYRYLRDRPDLDEVNFWRPTDKRRFRAVPTGSPFFFKLKRPHDAICGFAYFARFSLLPQSLAWEVFGPKNGAHSEAEMRDRIARLRRGRLERGEDPDIGCVLLVEPTFFPRDDWIPQPRDWSRTLVQGRSYDLSRGEGLRIWRACLARSRSAVRDVVEPERFGAPTERRPRLGQGTFRVSVLDAYGRRCAVSGEHSLPVLEAAHIRPYAKRGEHSLENGLLLRSDIHRLYDRGYVTVSPDRKFEVSDALAERWSNGRAYYQLAGQRIHVPRRDEERPSPDLLAWHREHVFRG